MNKNKEVTEDQIYAIDDTPGTVKTVEIEYKNRPIKAVIKYPDPLYIAEFRLNVGRATLGNRFSFDMAGSAFGLIAPNLINLEGYAIKHKDKIIKVNNDLNLTPDLEADLTKCYNRKIKSWCDLVNPEICVSIALKCFMETETERQELKN